MSHFAEATGYPPFPTDVPTIQLDRLSLSKLKAGDATESERLFKACKSGFFLLDLQDHVEGQRLIDTVEPVFGLGEDIFNLELAEKNRYAFQPGKAIYGYKGYGTATVDSKGTKDRSEFWSISKDDIFSISDPLPNPACITDQRTLMKNFMVQCHGVVEVMLSHLDSQLGLPSGTLASKQRLSQPSGDQVRLWKMAPQPEHDRRISLIPHTDLGTFTVLFNILGGLQILPPGGRKEVESDWKWVKPQRGCAIINVGDAMVHWTNGLLQSNFHRVTYAPGEQAKINRFSVAYLARPEHQIIMHPLEQSDLVRERGGFDDGTHVKGEFTALEWEKMKGKTLSVGRNETRGLEGGEVPKVEQVKLQSVAV